MDNNLHELDSVPEINSKPTFSRKVQIGLILAGLAVAGGVYYAISNPRNTAKKDKAPEYKRAAHFDFRYPEPPPPAKPVVKSEQENNTPTLAPKKKELTWEEKRWAGGFVGSNSGSTSSHLEQQKGEKKEEQTSPVKITETTIPTIQAAVMPDLDYTISRGRDIDCVLDDAISSQHPGEVRCHTPNDIYSDSGRVILLDKGSFAVGVYQGGSSIRYGLTKIGIAFEVIKTPYPNGVAVNLKGAATDSLGRVGLDGYVDNHFLDRIGAAFAISVIESAVQIAQQNLIPRNGNGNNNFFGGGGNFNSGGEQIVESILQQQANQPPTLELNQGDLIKIKVLKDLDFSNVYKLRAIP